MQIIVGNIGSEKIQSNLPGSSPNGIGSSVQLSKSDQKIVFAPKNKGMGTTRVFPEYKIVVPEDAPSGNYVGQVSYTLYQGP